MARRHDSTGQAKTIGTSAVTIVYTGQELPASVPGAAVVAYHFAIEGTGTAANDCTLNNITRIRAKANGTTIYDITPLELRAWYETFSWANKAPTDDSATGKAYQFTLPFWLPDASSEDEMDVSAFPMGNTPTIEIAYGATTGGGLIYSAWTVSDVRPIFAPVLYGAQMNIAAGATNGNYYFSEDGMVRGLGYNIKGLKRMKLMLGPNQKFNILGRTNTEANAVNCGSLLTETESFRTPLTKGISGGGDPNASGYNFRKLVGMFPAPPSSRVELDTNATDWAGVSNELTVYALRPQPKIQ